MKRSYPSCIMIDLDGTLANNIPTLFLAYKRFLATFHIAGTEKEFISLVGPPLPAAVEKLKEKYKIDRPADELVKMYEEIIQEGYRCSYELHTDADTFLEWAKREGIPLILATAAPKRLAMEFINRYDLARYFDQMITAEDSLYTKVDPHYFLNIASDPKSTLMIDDSATVINAAKKAGLRTHLFNNDWKQLLEQFAIRFVEVKLQPDFIVEVINSVHKEPLPEKIQKQIDELWEVETQRQETLFNGQLLSYIESSPHRLVGEFIQYKEYIAQVLRPDLTDQLKIQPVGLTVFVTDGKSVLVGRRSEKVATHHHLYELVPSGGIDASFFEKGRVNLHELVLHELYEEAGLTHNSVETLRATHLVHDPASDYYEVCFILTVKAAEEVKSAGEHTELLWIPFDKISEFVKENPFVPLSEYIIGRILGV